MVSETEHNQNPPRARASQYSLTDRIAVADGKCRCGTQIQAGAHYLEFAQIPDCLVDIFRGEVFCSRPCVRAYLLEAIATLEVPVAPSVVADFGSVYASLQALFMVS